MILLKEFFLRFKEYFIFVPSLSFLFEQKHEMEERIKFEKGRNKEERIRMERVRESRRGFRLM